MKLEFEVEMTKELLNEGNKSDHWSAKYQRSQARKHRLISLRYEIDEHRKKFKFPIKVMLIRLGPRLCDSDNWVTTAKAYRDFLSDLLIPGLAPGRSDGDESKIIFGYAQQTSKNKYYGLRIIIEDSS